MDYDYEDSNPDDVSPWEELEDSEEEVEQECPRCSNGCDYCLMVER